MVESTAQCLVSPPLSFLLAQAALQHVPAQELSLEPYLDTLQRLLVRSEKPLKQPTNVLSVLQIVIAQLANTVLQLNSKRTGELAKVIQANLASLVFLSKAHSLL